MALVASQVHVRCRNQLTFNHGNGIHVHDVPVQKEQRNVVAGIIGLVVFMDPYFDRACAGDILGAAQIKATEVHLRGSEQIRGGGQT